MNLRRDMKDLLKVDTDVSISDVELASVFLSLWDKAIGTPGYNKKEWQLLRQQLFHRDITV